MMAMNQSVARNPLTRAKLRYMFLLSLLLLATAGITNYASAASCAAGAVTIASGSGGCEVDGVNAVTTVQFQNGVTGGDALVLQGNAPSGAVTNVTDGEGRVEITGTVTSANTFGVAGTGDLFFIVLSGGATFNLGHDVSSTILTNNNIVNQTAGTLTLQTLNQGGTYNQSGGVINTSNFSIGNGDTFLQSGTGVLNVANSIGIDTGGSLTLVNQGTIGIIDGNSTNAGSVIFAGNFNTGGELGSFNGLASVTVNDGVTLTLDEDSKTTTFTVGNGTSGIVNHSAGTLTATNLNVSNGGTYNLSGSGNIAATNIALGTGSVLDANQAFTTIIGSTITGAGSLTKNGTGTLTLSGANSYNGGTTVSAGILQGTTTSLQGNITNNANVTFNQTTNGTYSGDMSGTGSLTKSNTGTVTLTGANTYSGGTTITAGTLQLGNGGTAGSITGNVTNNSALIFNRSDAITFGNVISGTGSVTQTGAGTTTLTGANTYSGGTTINAGTLQIGNGGTAGSITGNVTNNGTLSFNRSDAITFGNVISGTGSVTQAGAGSTNLMGVNTYNGATTINAGTLFVNGSIANSTTTVNAGGTLGGTGTVGSVNVSGGIFAPGNSIGTTNVAGNVDFSGGGIYQVEVNAAGQSDLINATGTATLTNGTVQVLPEAGTYGLSTDYTILTAAGGLGGTTFNSVTSNLAFLTPTLSYDATNVFLNLLRNDVTFSSVATSPNQIAVSNLLTTLSNSNPAALQAIIEQLLILTTFGAQQAFDSLSGVQHTNSQQLMQGQHQQFLQLLFNRTGFNPEYQFAFNPVQGPVLAYNHTGMNAGDNTSPERGWWLQGMGRFGEFDDTSNATGADYHSAGVAFGVDTGWRDWVLGIAGGFSNSDADTFGGDLDIDSFHGAVYAGREFNDGIYLNAAAGFAYHDTEADRTITVGTLTAQASADYDALTAGVGVEVGKVFELAQSTTLMPYAGIEYTHTDREDFTESGAGVMNLSVDDEDHDSLRTTLGVRVSEEITTGTNVRLKPYAYAAYVREHLDTEVTMEAGFTGAPASTFRIEGVDLDRDRAQVGIGINGQVNDRLAFNVGYNGEIADSDDHHGVSATVEYTW